MGYEWRTEFPVEKKETARRPVLLTVRRAVLCLLWNYACVCLLWQLLDLLSYAPPEKRYALTVGAVTFLAVMIFLVAGLDQLAPGQGTHDTVSRQSVGLLERQHGGLCLASEDAVHAAAVIAQRVQQLLQLAHRVSAGAGAEHGLGRDGRHVHGRGIIELRPSEFAHDAVHAKVISLLEGSHRRIGLGSEDAVHVAGVVAQRVQLILQRLDSVAGAASVQHRHIGYCGGVVATSAGGGGLVPQLDRAGQRRIVGVGGSVSPPVALVRNHLGGGGVVPSNRTAGRRNGTDTQGGIRQRLAGSGDLGIGRFAGGGGSGDGDLHGRTGDGVVFAVARLGGRHGDGADPDGRQDAVGINSSFASAVGHSVGHRAGTGAAAGTKLQGLTVDHGGAAGNAQCLLIIPFCQSDV